MPTYLIWWAQPPPHSHHLLPSGTPKAFFSKRFNDSWIHGLFLANNSARTCLITRSHDGLAHNVVVIPASAEMTKGMTDTLLGYRIFP